MPGQCPQVAHFGGLALDTGLGEARKRRGQGQMVLGSLVAAFYGVSHPQKTKRPIFPTTTIRPSPMQPSAPLAVQGSGTRQAGPPHSDGDHGFPRARRRTQRDMIDRKSFHATESKMQVDHQHHSRRERAGGRPGWTPHELKSRLSSLYLPQCTPARLERTPRTPCGDAGIATEAGPVDVITPGLALPDVVTTPRALAVPLHLAVGEARGFALSQTGSCSRVESGKQQIWLA
jgi:hypothetical protein